MSLDSINWKEAAWQAEDRQASADIIITADWAPIRDFDPIITAEPKAVYGDLLGELEKADLRVTNLECVMADEGIPVDKSGSVFKGMNHHVAGLTAAPFEVVTLGNNHVFDYGTDAFQNTLELLERENISHVGAGLSKEEAEKPLVKEVKGLKIAFVNFSEGEDMTSAGPGPGVFGWEVDRVCEIVENIKGEVNAVIVVCHAGLEYIPFPPPYIAEAFHKVADAGADLVIGHHPHVPQGMEIYKGTPICYSLGNFVFFQKNNLKYRKLGYMVKASFSEEGIAGVRLIPYRIGDKNLSLLAGDELTSFNEKMKEISEPLQNFSKITEAWNGFLKYYGLKGFRDEIGGILSQTDEDLKKAAAKFRNRLTCQQHYHQLVDLMTLLVDGKLDKAPDWGADVAKLWFTETID